MNHSGGMWTESSSRGHRRRSGPEPAANPNGGITVIIISGRGKPALVIAPGERAPSGTLRRGDRLLAPGETASFARAGQTLHVVSGCAWVTFAGEDRVVLAGQHVLLQPGADAAVVSALSGEPLVYRLVERPGITG